MLEMNGKYRLWSTSLLLIYEGDAAGSGDTRVDVRLVDFAQVAHESEILEPDVIADPQADGYVWGVRRLIEMLQECLSTCE